MKLPQFFLGLLILSLSCDRNRERASHSEGTTTQNRAIKKDTTFISGLTRTEVDSILNDFESAASHFKDSIGAVKMYEVKGDTVLLDKCELKELSQVADLDPLESAFLYKGDTLLLSNDCNGAEMICYGNNLKVIYSYNFDCVEGCSRDALKYFYLNNRIVAYQDNFTSNCFPENEGDSKIASTRKETFVLDLNKNPIGLRRETITTKAGFDTIKISRTSITGVIDRSVVKKLLTAKCMCRFDAK